MGRVANFVASFAALNVLMCAAAGAQVPVQAALQIAGRIDAIVESAVGIYGAVRTMIDLSGGDPPPPIPNTDQDRDLKALQRHEELSRSIGRLQAQMLALEQTQIETRDEMYNLDQIQLYRSAFLTASSSFDLVRDYFQTPRDRRAAMDDEILQQLIRVSEQASGQTIAPRERLGPHYVAALNITTLALVNLRSIYPTSTDALPQRFRNRMRGAIDYLDQTTGTALASDGLLATVASAELNAYRLQLANLAQRSEVAQLVSGTRFRIGAAQACFQVALRRDCEGRECGDWWENIGRPRPRVTIGYRQARYPYVLERSTAGRDLERRDFNLMKGLRPSEVPEITSVGVDGRDETCQPSSNPDRSWREAAEVLQYCPT